MGVPTLPDASGNYLFEGVQPGTLIVRWDLSYITTKYRITEADQAGDDALDSDGVSGDVGGLVYTMEFDADVGIDGAHVIATLSRLLLIDSLIACSLPSTQSRISKDSQAL